MTAVVVNAPISGWATSLDDVPDPVFAERMMGGGVAIDPLDEWLRAPCEAEVIGIAATGHSVTLELVNGAQLLLHIGLETVALAGHGFTVETKMGARVSSGDPLIRIDLEKVAMGARSLITPIVVTNDGYDVRAITRDRAVASGEPLMEVHGPLGVQARAADASGVTSAREMVIGMAHGLHARPAARIVAALKPFAAEVRIAAHGRTANARSMVGLLSLGLAQGDTMSITATGHDALLAVDAVGDLVASGMEEAQAAPSPSLAPPEPRATQGPVFTGVRAAPGLALGPLAIVTQMQTAVPEEGKGPAHEAAALEAAIASLSSERADHRDPDAVSIAAAHRAILDDPELISEARRGLAAGKSAAFAWRTATAHYAAAIRATGNALLIERIADLTDVELCLVAKLLGKPAFVAPTLSDGAILVADDLLPSQFMALATDRLGGIVTARGGPTSHVAILAASAGIPMLVAAGAGVLQLVEGRPAILDANAGTLDSDPSPDAQGRAAQWQVASAHERAAQAEQALTDCAMADGTRIEIFVNLASATDAVRAVRLGAEGCGLLRTEFLFLDRPTPPTEEEQRLAYAGIAAALGGRPLIVRTLDVGADKPVAFLAQEHEDNPALGRRGVRLSLHRPDLLATQLRAILAAVPAAQCRIMVPMVVDRDELRAVRRLLDEAARAVGADAQVPLGVMIETPAAALMAESIAAEADFLSIGTNDLTQYALAADRGNPAVATLLDPLHPAVLRLIASAAAGAKAHGRGLACAVAWLPTPTPRPC